ncbi:MAG: hydrolase [Anaeromusa sp.]|uniref:C40 family peptidase n=1 Tax=Anaeromusa sp. TaxID=1872520 RepID=UPI002B1F0B24|nr:hydrolase [Anaeromusa sp.]MEA4835374.1 hydrolase [Anaeromusa sp.]
MNIRESVVAEAKAWLNTPYHSGARLKGVGVDCGQLLIGVYENAGFLQQGECEPGAYAFDWHLHRSEEKYLSWVQKYCDLIDGDPLPGDIAVFQFGRCISHAGIVIAWPVIIHAYVGMGVIMSSVNEALFMEKAGKSRLKGIYRPRGW